MTNIYPSYAGKILRIDLTNRKIIKEELPKELIRNYIGGKGIAARLLYDEVNNEVSPLDPANKLIFATGPATGTIVPHKGYNVTFKSPLTGIYACSSAGGFFGDDDDDVQILKGDHLWGKDSFETRSIIQRDHGSDFEVARIGIAGEKLVRFASIMNDYSRTAGRCGAGAVMGSKNLKAIAVRGTRSVEVERIDELVEFVHSLIARFKEIPSFKVMSKYGPLCMVDPYHEFGLLVTKYWHEGLFKPFLDRGIDVDKILSGVKVKDKACCSCPLNCSNICISKGGEYAGTIVEGLDFEPFMSFGPLLYNDNIDTIMKCIEICDRMGMDAISTGNVIAFAMECYEKGIITSKETGGVELNWGSSDAIVQITESIGKREGFGDVLAEGVREASRKIGKGAENLAMHIKGLELPMYDPRAKSYGLAIAVADRGACHCQGEMHVYYARGVYKGRIINRDSFHRWPEIIKEIEDLGAVKDSFIFCRFFRDLYDEETISKLTPYLMGVRISVKELRLIGERIINLVRAFNVREGISRKDDYPPDRFFKEPIPEGPAKGAILNREEFETALNRYYELRGWNRDGIPRKETLIKLALYDVVDDIKNLFDKEKEGS